MSSLATDLSCLCKIFCSLGATYLLHPTSVPCLCCLMTPMWRLTGGRPALRWLAHSNMLAVLAYVRWPSMRPTLNCRQQLRHCVQCSICCRGSYYTILLYEFAEQKNAPKGLAPGNLPWTPMGSLQRSPDPLAGAQGAPLPVGLGFWPFPIAFFENRTLCVNH